MATSEGVSRIAVLHLNQVGDLVFSLPALLALRAGFPSAHLISVLRRGLAPLLEGSDLVDEIVDHEGSRDFFQTAERLKDLELDLAVCLSESPRSRLLAYLSRSPRRVGLGSGPLSSLLTERLEKVGLPSVANDLRLLRAIGCPTPAESYVGLIGVSAAEREEAASILRRAGLDASRRRLVVLAPGASAGRSHKEWPAGRFVEVAGSVVAARDRAAVVVGTEARLDLGDPPPEGILDLTGRTSLRQLAGLLALASVFVGNDSGALHLAAALGTPCVALFGPTDPDETGPHGAGHAVLRAAPRGPGPIESIATAEVVAAVERLLGAGRAG